MRYYHIYHKKYISKWTTQPTSCTAVPRRLPSREITCPGAKRQATSSLHGGLCIMSSSYTLNLQRSYKGSWYVMIHDVMFILNHIDMFKLRLKLPPKPIQHLHWPSTELLLFLVLTSNTPRDGHLGHVEHREGTDVAQDLRPNGKGMETSLAFCFSLADVNVW